MAEAVDGEKEEEEEEEVCVCEGWEGGEGETAVWFTWMLVAATTVNGGSGDKRGEGV